MIETMESLKSESIHKLMLSEYDCSELALLLISLSPSLLYNFLTFFIDRDDKQSLDNQAITFLANAYIALSSSLPHKSSLFLSFIPSGYSFIALCLHCLLYHVPQLQYLSTFLTSILTAELTTHHSLSILTFFYSLRHFSCSLSKYVHSACCHLCLHRPEKSLYGDYPNNLFLQASNTFVDMNELYFVLFQSLHSSMMVFFNDRFNASSQPSDEDLSICENYCCVVASLVYHSLSVLSFIINQGSNFMIRSVNYTQDQEAISDGMRSSWVFLNYSSLREFLWKIILSQPSLYTNHSSGVLYLLLAYVFVDVMCEGIHEDLSSTMLQITGFQPLLGVIEIIEGELKQASSDLEYQQRVTRYQPMLYGIMSVMGGVCVNLEFYPNMLAHLSLLTIHLFHWLMLSDHWIVSDLSLQHLVRIARYSIIIHKKSLWVLLPECIIAGIIQSLLTLDPSKQQAIIQSVFDESDTLSQWYSKLAPYVIPVYINQLDTQTLISLCRAIDPNSTIYNTLTLLFQGSQCIYNVIVYLLKHMIQENTKSWELLFFLRSPFTDQAIEQGQIDPPESSRVSIKHLIQQQGHRVLWPLLYDCTDVISHDRDMSETALRSLYE